MQYIKKLFGDKRIRLRDLTQYIKKLFVDKRIRFLFVGCVNTAVGYGSYALLVFCGVNVYLATTLSTVIGIINSYFWNKFFTFKSPAKSATEILRFVTVYAISYSINLLLIYIFVDRFKLDKYISGLICLFFTTIISYIGHNFFSFKNQKDR